MSLFKKPRKKQNKVSILPNFVLLDSAELDIDLFIKDFQDEWGIKIPAMDENVEKDSEFPMIVVEFDNMKIVVSLMPAPIPNGEAVDNAKTNFRWPNAVEVAESHKAHVLIIVMPLGEQSLLEVATLQTKLCVTCLKQPNAIAINAAGTVFDPDFYKDSAHFAFENKAFPIMNHVFFGLYSNDDGKTFSGYTYGLSNLGKQDIEILDSNQNANEVLEFMVDISTYIIESDAILKDGETIGFTAEQKIPITESDGIAVDGKTLKIGF
ncbi:MAG: DUF4261 domain-containing protein [Defluviitaleaceae bacterium]|nr:DUF4261 domain-containing protein [Defluviitaleaceae bacterium]